MIHKLCDADHLPREGELKAFAGSGTTDALALCVAVLGGRAYAVDNACPHARAELAAGHLAGGSVVCPLHGWAWDIVTGDPVHSGDPCLQTYEIRQYGSEVFVRIPASSKI